MEEEKKIHLISSAFKFMDVEDGMQTTRISSFLKFHELLGVIYFTLSEGVKVMNENIREDQQFTGIKKNCFRKSFSNLKLKNNTRSMHLS